MTDSQHQSYYELALTNRQVMVAFVVLLVCIFVAFFSGIWIGRKGVAESPSQGPAMAAETEGEDLDLGTLEFFSEPAGEKPLKEPDTAKRKKKAGTTLLEDIQGSKPTPPVETPPAAAESPSLAESGTSVGPEPVKSAPPAAEPETRTGTTLPAPDEASVAADLLVIQVFSSSDGVQATQLKDRLLSAGYSAFISSVDVGGRTMHRVRIGPFQDRGEASEIADRVRRDFKLDTWITR